MRYSFIFILLIFISCSGNPVPEKAVQLCIEAGGMPYYFSQGLHGTKFTCVPEDVTEFEMK